MGATNVLAHDQQHRIHNSEAISPFDGEQKKGAPHCLLNKHRHKNKFCPHASKSATVGKQRISADCGGKPPGTLPSIFPSKDNIDNSSFVMGLSTFSLRLSAEIYSGTQQYLNIQDPPPELL